jgi:hypothetical protein
VSDQEEAARCTRNEKRNRTFRVRFFSLSARGPTITFQRGTADAWTTAAVATVIRQCEQYAEGAYRDNTTARMPAMRLSQLPELIYGHAA